MEAVELSKAVVVRESGERAASFPQRVTGERRGMKSTHKSVSLSSPSRAPGEDEPMPTDPILLEAQAWMAGRILHHNIPVGPPEEEVRVNGRRVRAILDTGSSVSLI